jgi:hypothetical protein
MLGNRAQAGGAVGNLVVNGNDDGDPRRIAARHAEGRERGVGRGIAARMAQWLGGLEFTQHARPGSAESMLGKAAANPTGLRDQALRAECQRSAYT